MRTMEYVDVSSSIRIKGILEGYGAVSSFYTWNDTFFFGGGSYFAKIRKKSYNTRVT